MVCHDIDLEASEFKYVVQEAPEDIVHDLDVTCVSLKRQDQRSVYLAIVLEAQLWPESDRSQTNSDRPSADAEDSD